MNIKKEKLNNNSTTTVNSKQLEILKNNFPQCFDKNGNFIVNKIEEIITNNGLELSKESYSLNWLGKSYARLLANDNPLTMLKEDKIHNCLEENKNSQNILIKGDNLEVLKHLKNAYENQIKMIYIDPPYNTGSDGFVYNDNRKFTIEELSQLAGVSLEEAKRILEFTESNSNSHSAWLTFMYPRLYIARELLKNDGVIFISIDDNEVSQLKLLCDEVFGEDNFLNQIIIKSKPSSGASGGGEDKKLKKNIEYLLCYTNNRDYFLKFNDIYASKDLFEYIEEYKSLGKSWKYTRVLYSFGNKTHFTNTVDGSGEEIKIYKHSNVVIKTIKELAEEEKLSIEDIYIKYYDKIFRDTNAQSSIRQRVIDVTDSDDTFYSIEYFPRSGKSKNKLTTLYYKGKNKDLLAWLKDVASKKNNTLFKDDKIGTFWDNFNWNNVSKEGDVSYPNGKKPIELIKRMIALISSIEKNDIILDFFAGSGSTGHAVMDINANDDGSRKYIMVQIQEEIINNKDNKELIDICDNLKVPKMISEITQERLIRSAKSIKKQYSDYQGDLGFKIFETTSLLKNPLDKMDKFDEKNPKLFDVTTLKEDDFNTLLTTWKVYDGMKLTDELKEVTFKSYKAYYGDKKLYFIHSGFTTEDLKEFIKKLDEDINFEPNKLILFGYIFASRYQREISEALTSYANKKSIEINMIVRY